MYSIKIKALQTEYNELVAFCREAGQVSFELYINNIYKKTLLLSAASYFESEITKWILDYANRNSHNNAKLVAFIDNKAIKRQYHTFFSWDASNANHFFALFGDDFKQNARAKIKEQKLEDAENAFLKIGRERNCLVHQNYIETQVNYTFEEIYATYEKACGFLDLFYELLNG